jgi:hypothetical protein
VGEDSVPRLNVLDLQMQIRRLPKPVVAMVAGYAVGGGHILHMVCDLTVSSPCHLRSSILGLSRQSSCVVQDGVNTGLKPCAVHAGCLLCCVTAVELCCTCRTTDQ